MTRPSESFEEKRPDESDTEARMTPSSEDVKDYTFVAHGILALLGAVVILCAIEVAVFCVHGLSLSFFPGLKEKYSVVSLPSNISFFFWSCFFIYIGYLLARCWGFVACVGAATLLTFSGLGIISGLLDANGYNPLYLCLSGAALFLFAFSKRDTLRYVAKKKPEGSIHNACSCAACRQSDAIRPLPSSSACESAATVAAEEKRPDKNNVLEKYT